MTKYAPAILCHSNYGQHGVISCGLANRTEAAINGLYSSFLKVVKICINWSLNVTIMCDYSPALHFENYSNAVPRYTMTSLLISIRRHQPLHSGYLGRVRNLQFQLLQRRSQTHTYTLPVLKGVRASHFCKSFSNLLTNIASLQSSG